MSAIPVVAERTGRPVVLVGGLAVLCRLAAPYRVTTDLDTVDRRRIDQDPQLQLLVTAGATASSLVLRVDELPPLAVAVAEPGPIIAMKLQSIMNRGAAKEGTDLLDIVRLTLDPRSGPASRDQLDGAAAQLRADALLHARRWFHEGARRSLSKVRAVPEGREIDLDDLVLVGDLLVAALDG